jgi:hypothetical protein
MLKVGNCYITLTFLAVSVLLFSKISHADSYVCQAEHASGFVYDLENKTWEASTFSIENRKYLISQADTKNIFIKALKYDYAIKMVDSSKPIIHCKTVKLTDSNEETGLVTCRGSFGASFNFDKRNGRYIRTQPAGYVTLKSDSNAGNGPYMEIGNCSPK